MKIIVERLRHVCSIKSRLRNFYTLFQCVAILTLLSLMRQQIAKITFRKIVKLL